VFAILYQCHYLLVLDKLRNKVQTHLLRRGGQNEKACLNSIPVKNHSLSVKQLSYPVRNWRSKLGDVGPIDSSNADSLLQVVNFPFPTPPDRSALSSAERTLISLSALHPRSTIITPLGKSMSAYPISPRHARMLLAALEMGGNSKTPKSSRKKELRLLAHAIAAAAALSSESPFLREGFGGLGEKEGEGEGVGLKEKGDFADDWDADANERREEKAKSKAADEEKERRRKRRSAARAAHAKFTVQGSEALSAAAALRTYEEAVTGAGERVSQTGPSAGERFCYENHLHARTMKEMAQLRQQLTRLVGANLGREEAAPDLEPGISHAAGKGPILNRRNLEKQNIELLESALKEPLGRGEEAKLRRAVCAGWADRIARKLRPGESVPGETEEGKSRRAVRYQACSAPGVVFLHPSSSMAKDAPDFVCYTDLMQTEKRTYMQVRAIVCCRLMVTSSFCVFLQDRLCHSSRSVVSFFRISCVFFQSLLDCALFSYHDTIVPICAFLYGLFCCGSVVVTSMLFQLTDSNPLK
jgi:hypothetical protein